jgi:hypothetical protein
MDFSGAGTAIMVALAAALWFLYLVPTWFRRREYLATERNATRLQRAIRVMAETAELPDEVRFEASAREAAQREKLLRQEQRRADAIARAEVTAAAARARAAEARAAEIERAARAVIGTADRVVQQRPVAPVAHSTSVRPRLRRARRVAGLLLLAALVVGVVQSWLVITTGAVLGSWLVLAGCAVGAAVSISLQRRIVARSHTLAPTTARPAARRSTSVLMDAELAVAPVREWTPVPVPKPLYLEHQQAPRVPLAPAASAEELLRAAAAEAERALAAAHAEPEVVPFPVRPTAPTAAPQPSRYASMGIVESGSGQLPDLDEVLRRRRLG